MRQGPGEVQTLADNLTVDVGNGATGKLTFEDYDTAGIHESVTHPERLTAPRTGAYLVSGAVNFASDPDGSRSLGIAIDGTTCCGRVQVPVTGNSNTLLSTSTIVALGAGESVTLTAGIAGAKNPLDLSQVTFAIHWLGPVS